MLRLYTDESPGLKVDPMVIMFLSLGFIFSVVALHCESSMSVVLAHAPGANHVYSDCENYEAVLIGARAIGRGWRTEDKSMGLDTASMYNTT
jgi:hypothetical protein